MVARRLLLKLLKVLWLGVSGAWISSQTPKHQKVGSVPSQAHTCVLGLIPSGDTGNTTDCFSYIDVSLSSSLKYIAYFTGWGFKKKLLRGREWKTLKTVNVSKRQGDGDFFPYGCSITSLQGKTGQKAKV